MGSEEIVQSTIQFTLLYFYFTLPHRTVLTKRSHTTARHVGPWPASMKLGFCTFDRCNRNWFHHKCFFMLFMIHQISEDSKSRTFKPPDRQVDSQKGRPNTIKTLKSWNHRWRAKNAQRPMPQGSLPPHGHALSRHFVRSNMTMSRETWNCTRDWSSVLSSVDFGIRRARSSTAMPCNFRLS